MPYLQSLPLILALIYGTRAVSSLLPTSVGDLEKETLLYVQKNELDEKSGSNVVSAQQLCPTTCSCTITAQAVTVTRCTKDPSAVMNRLLQSRLNITTLAITQSRLTRVPERLCQLTQLITLQLNNNRLETLPWQCMRNLSYLHYVDASFNLIKRLENESFYDMHLQHLILSNNLISEIDIDVFTQPNRLQELAYIDLHANRLESLDVWPIMLTQAPLVDLSRNQISRFTNLNGWTTTCQFKPTGELKLEYNRITHMKDMMDGWNLTHTLVMCILFQKTYYINIQYNKLICDCIDFEMYKFMDMIHRSKKIAGLFCDKPLELRARNLLVIPLQQFICHIKLKCPDQCDCIDIPAKLNMSVLCRSPSIKAMPEELPKLPKFHSRYSLKFVDSRITNLEYRSYLNRTNYAVFTRNIISELSLDALNALRNAELVALDYNKLKYLPKNISTVNMTTVKDLRLANNEWACDCHAKETQRWLIQTQAVISDKGAILCKTPPDKSGFNLLLLSEDELTCGDPPNKVLITSLIAVGASVGTSILSVVLFRFLKRVWLYKKYRWHPFNTDECEGEDKEFDIFVSYANEDGDYVEDYLIPTLQNKGYKIAYHRIHFLPGRSIQSSIEYCVAKSKRTLVVFSDSFIESVWCMFEFTCALEYDCNNGTHRLLTILYDDVQVSALDLRVRTYFRMYSYIKANSSQFWEKLEYRLPLMKMGEDGDVTHDIMDNALLQLDDAADDQLAIGDDVIQDPDIPLLFVHD